MPPAPQSSETRMGGRVPAWILSGFLVSCAWSGTAHADPPPSPGTIPVAGAPVGKELPRRHGGKRLVWDPAFNRMDAPEMVVTGASAAIALTAAIVPPLNTGWKGGVLFDDAVRDALRPGSYKTRLDYRDASDVGIAFMTTFPVLFDSLIVAYWYRGSDEVGLQMTLIDAEALSISAGIQGATAFFAGRERPYVSGCGSAIGSSTIDCTTVNEQRSFFSGHSALSFTGAALICAHHMALDLFDSAADPITCVTGFLAAGAVATFRVVGDMHYASDVIVGAVVGTAIGLGVPLLHHYKREEAATRTSLRVVPTGTGAALTGTFE